MRLPALEAEASGPAGLHPDELDPTRPSTDPKVPYAHTRSRCLMLSGQCDAGKKLMVDYFAAQGAMDAKTIDTVVKVDYDKMCGK